MITQKRAVIFFTENDFFLKLKVNLSLNFSSFSLHFIKYVLELSGKVANRKSLHHNIISSIF